MKPNPTEESIKMLNKITDSQKFDNSDNKNSFFQIKYNPNDPDSHLWKKRPKNFIEPKDVLIQGVFEKIGRNLNVRLRRYYFVCENCLYYKKVKKTFSIYNINIFFRPFFKRVQNPKKS